MKRCKLLVSSNSTCKCLTGYREESDRLLKLRIALEEPPGGQYPLTPALTRVLLMLLLVVLQQRDLVSQELLYVLLELLEVEGQQLRVGDLVNVGDNKVDVVLRLLF